MNQPPSFPNDPGYQYGQVLRPQQLQQQRMPYSSAFFGGLAVEIIDVMWISIISIPGANGQNLVHQNIFLNWVAILLFLCTIIVALLLVIGNLIKLAHLKRWGWFIGLLFGSIFGSTVLFLPGVALMAFGLWGPRTPTDPEVPYYYGRRD